MNRIWTTGMAMVAVQAALSGQAGAPMAEPGMHEKATTYTGCVASFNHGAQLLLTHVAQTHRATDHDGMHDGMNGAAGMDKMDDPVISSDKEHMMPSPVVVPASFVLSGPSSLKKHLGQTVTVTGTLSKGSMDTEMMDGGMKSERETLIVRSLRVVGKTCG